MFCGGSAEVAPLLQPARAPAEPPRNTRGAEKWFLRGFRAGSAEVPRRFRGTSAEVPRLFRVLWAFCGGSAEVPHGFRGGSAGGGGFAEIPRRFRGGCARGFRRGSAPVLLEVGTQEVQLVEEQGLKWAQKEFEPSELFEEEERSHDLEWVHRCKTHLQNGVRSGARGGARSVLGVVLGVAHNVVLDPLRAPARARLRAP